MTDVDTLRRAAALMRERAEGATPGPWESGLVGVYSADPPRGAGLYVAHWESETETPQMKDRVHIASWHPTVALAVADLLDLAATHEKCAGDDCGQGYGPGGRYGDIDPSCSVCGTPDEYAEPWPCEYVKRGVALATAYLSDAS